MMNCRHLAGDDFCYTTQSVTEGNMKKILTAVGAIAIVGIAGLGLYLGTQSNDQSQQAPVAATQQAQTIQISADKKTVSYDGVDGQTALASLQSLTAVETKSTAYGDMVIAIAGTKADESVEFWGFYVNGQMANEGAGTYKATTGDKIEWRLEKLQQ